MGVAIEVRDISKQFRLYNERYTSLKERVIHGGKMPFTPFWALQDVNVDINQGETFGILGRNGCGKSTLLKCVAGILKPTTGEIRVRGSLAAMLELGAGFQPELSGRDNIYLNGSLLGSTYKFLPASQENLFKATDNCDYPLILAQNEGIEINIITSLAAANVYINLEIGAFLTGWGNP